jgi:leucine dehydrogenase
MNEKFFSLIENWDGQGVVVRHDRPTGTWIFIALHDLTLGPAIGGSRMKVYPDLADALLDAMRLAEGMTAKWAGIGVARGGGKAVLAIPRPLVADEREGLLLRYAELIESLGGAFGTGADLGTGPADMAVLARKTRFVFGVDRKTGLATDPGPFTARGVFAGISAALAHVFGSAEAAGRSVLVEGLGGVGSPLCRSLAAAGTRLLVADLDHEKARLVAHELGAEAVALAEVPDTACDVYAPCAVGATLNEETVPRLRCRIVAGSANNQLRGDDDALRLHDRGIVYVPDYIVNAGGAIALVELADEKDRDAIFEKVEEIGPSVTSLLQEAAENGESPLAAARRRVERILAGRN